jgi:hypothetical protein
MNEQQLKILIENAKRGRKIEETHTEVKREWYDLTKEDFKKEFVKDVVALANARGDCERNLIFGLDENTGDLFDSKRPMDEAALQQIINSNCEPLIIFTVEEYSIDGITLSVVNIPKSDNRPHLIKKYKVRDTIENYIPVRHGTTTDFASRSDLDEMYNRLIKEGRGILSLDISENEVIIRRLEQKFYIYIPIEISNIGDKPNSVRNISLMSNEKISVEPHSKDTDFWHDGQAILLPFKIDVGETKKIRPRYMITHVMENNFCPPFKIIVEDNERNKIEAVLSRNLQEEMNKAKNNQSENTREHRYIKINKRPPNSPYGDET